MGRQTWMAEKATSPSAYPDNKLAVSRVVERSKFPLSNKNLIKGTFTAIISTERSSMATIIIPKSVIEERLRFALLPSKRCLTRAGKITIESGKANSVTGRKIIRPAKYREKTVPAAKPEANDRSRIIFMKISEELKVTQKKPSKIFRIFVALK